MLVGLSSWFKIGEGVVSFRSPEYRGLIRVIGMSAMLSIEVLGSSERLLLADSESLQQRYMD